MPLFKDISRFKFLILVILLIGFNLAISLLVVYFKTPITRNYLPAGFGLGNYIAILIFAFGAYLIYKFDFLKKFPVVASVLIAGATSNFLEYNIFGFVVDYLDIKIAVMNLADLEIYGSLIYLNWKTLLRNN